MMPGITGLSIPSAASSSTSRCHSSTWKKNWVIAKSAAKLQAADFAITQFFFHVEEWQRLVDELAALGIDKPVIPGIMPITNLASIQRMAQLSGYAVPADVIAQLEKGGDDPQAVRRIGIELACALCTDLLEAGVPGLHFYTLNFSTATREIYSGLGLVTA